MRLSDAVFKRIDELAIASNITLSQLAIKSGMTPSTLYQIKTKDIKLPSLLTVKRLCDGLKITLSEFFNTEDIDNSDFE